MIGRVVLVSLLATVSPGLGAAQATVGAQQGDAAGMPASPSDFDFLEGRWTIVYNNAQAGIPPDVAGTWVALKQADGRVLYDEFRLFGPDGRTAALGATYRVFDHVRQRWDMRYVGLLARGSDGTTRLPAQWAELTAWREGATVRVDQHGNQTWLRITYYDITHDHFSWRADVSPDKGRTWRSGQIRIEARRTGDPPQRQP